MDLILLQCELILYHLNCRKLIVYQDKWLVIHHLFFLFCPNCNVHFKLLNYLQKHGELAEPWASFTLYFTSAHYYVSLDYTGILHKSIIFWTLVGEGGKFHLSQFSCKLLWSAVLLWVESWHKILPINIVITNFFLQGWILGWWGIRSLLSGYFGCVVVIKEMPFDKISTVLWDGSKTCWKYQGQNCNGIFVWSDHHYFIKIINVSFTNVLLQLREMQVVILFNNKPFLNK